MRLLRYVWMAAFLSFAGLCHAGAEDGNHLRGRPDADGPLEVRISFQVINITDVNEKEETFDFEGAIYLMWMDPRQAYDPVALGLTEKGFVPGDYTKAPQLLYQGDYAVKELFEGWRPHVTLSNGVGDRQMTYMVVGIYPDGMMIYGDHFHAKAETPMNLRRFPFDRQKIELYLHPLIYQRNEVILIHTDRQVGSWQQDVGIAEWKKLGFEIQERPLEYTPSEGRTRVISELVVTIDLGRRPGHILFSIIFPLLVLVSLTWCVFWLDEEAISNRVSISLVGILSVVAYYFVILESVPRIAYLTMMDAFMIATFLILAASVVISIVVDKLNRAGCKAVGDRLDRTCRWAFPLGYAVVIALVVFVFSIMG